MTHRYPLIVFDWDGTLMDSAAAIVYAVQAAAQDLGLVPPSDERARHIIGLGLIDALRHALPDLPEQRYGELSARYRYHYLARDHELGLFAGAAALVQGLVDGGHMVAIATGKSRLGLDRALAVSGIGGLFHASRCADECQSKPHPQMLEELLAEFGVSADAALMIGDTSHDLLMARNAGVDGLGVAYGAHPRGELEALKPLYCAASIAELQAWLQANA